MAISLRNEKVLPETPGADWVGVSPAELTGLALTPTQHRFLLTDVEPQQSPGYDCYDGQKYCEEDDFILDIPKASFLRGRLLEFGFVDGFSRWSSPGSHWPPWPPWSHWQLPWDTNHLN